MHSGHAVRPLRHEYAYARQQAGPWTDPAERGAFASIVSAPLALVDGYAGLRVKVAWEQDTSGNWIYTQANTCLCSTASLACMPNGTEAPYVGVQVRACVADYSWVIAGQGFAKYYATILGFGGDPAMGWQ